MQYNSITYVYGYAVDALDPRFPHTTHPLPSLSTGLVETYDIHLEVYPFNRFKVHNHDSEIPHYRNPLK